MDSSLQAQKGIATTVDLRRRSSDGRRAVSPERRAPSSPCARVDLWVIRAVNPDGLALRVRQNAEGTDLNRNFGFDWGRPGPPRSRFYGGPRPFSAPESRIVRGLTDLLRPAVTLW